METKELDNLSGDELFEVLKGKCKSKSRVNISVGLALFILIIAGIIYRKIHPFEYRQGIPYISFFIEYALIGCACGLWALNNYRFLKKSDSLDTPDQLMYWFEKKVRNDRIYFFICLSAYLLDLCLCFYTPLWVGLTVFIAFFAFGAFLYFKYDNSIWNSSNKILDQLRELVDKE